MQQEKERGSLIPVIDFDSCGLHRHTTEKDVLRAVGLKVKDAFSSVGFCYIKNHGVDPNVVDSYMEQSQQFFELPVEEKMIHAKTVDRTHGWVALESEYLNPERPADLKEAFNYCPSDEPGVWQSNELKQASIDMFKICKKLAYRVCDALSVGLDLGDTFLRDAHKYVGQANNATTLRSLYYPPIQSDCSIKPGQIRLGEHSDYGTITLLFQDEIGGLEVNIPGIGFVPATPIPDTIVVNIGDLMQRWTSDNLVATKHRVLLPEDEMQKRKPRQSAVFFVNPDNEYIIHCLDGSNKYEPISTIDYLKYKFSSIMKY